ncbi:MAG: hypothetical protein L6262_06030 [Weeksellaceae bacterium]|nr:hypothetical protein [Weeksellaceae bacterium]
MLSKWDLGDGAGFYNGKMVEDIFLPDAGVYKVQHQAVGQGGIVGATASQTITVDNPDPVAGNLVQGGKFLNSADVAKWSFSFPNPAGTALWTFNNGSATIVAQNYQGNVMYQAINVVAGRTYKADAVVSSNGVVNSLLEIYVGYKKPSLYSDYTGDGTDSSWLRAINTWAGSGTSPFSGKISVVGSQNPTNPNGTFTATQTGLVYFAIRALGADMKAGITISNVEFRGSN